MVRSLNEHTTPWKWKAKHHLRPEADITNVDDTMLQDFGHIQVEHIRSHQDTRNPDNISWEARLNILADALASEQRENMSAPRTNVTNTTSSML
jgi:hypothetical protein